MDSHHAEPVLTLNPQAQIEIIRFGSEGQTVLVADDVLLDPQAMVSHAAQLSFGTPPAGSKYPGLMAPVPQTYISLLADVLRQSMVQVFGMHPDLPLKTYGFFGLATLGVDQMTKAQVAPHTDAHRLNSFATVHYLSARPQGGTAFYRHKASGLELITPIRSDKFSYLRRQELAGADDAPVREAFYDEILSIDPRFNRLILYRAGQLHSAKLDPAAPLSASPADGRLTANLFFNTEGF
jgi:hypothetical protein